MLLRLFPLQMISNCHLSGPDDLVCLPSRTYYFQYSLPLSSVANPRVQTVLVVGIQRLSKTKKEVMWCRRYS